MRIFGGERVKALMFRLGMTEGVPIESGLISRRIENAQKSVEAQISTPANTCLNTTT